MRIKLNKYSFLTIVGAVLPTASYAQTFYQCMPLTCKAGEYKDGTDCVKCPAGTYNPKEGATSVSACLRCGAGTYTSAGSSSCLPCPEGHYCPGGTDKRACSAGSYASGTRNTSCTSCAAGTASNATGASSCPACKPGTYTGTTGQQSCWTCPYGSYCGTATKTPTKCGNHLWSDAGSKSQADCKMMYIRLWFMNNYDSSNSVGTWFPAWVDSDVPIMVGCKKYGPNGSACNMDPEDGEIRYPNGDFEFAPTNKTMYMYSSHKNSSFGAGAPRHIIAGETALLSYDCKTLPCTITGTKSGNGIRKMKLDWSGSSTSGFSVQCTENGGSTWFDCQSGLSPSEFIKWE